ncbi:bifunctional protein tyrosine phosphatase family protein/NAD(P)/FAD-dependent oxidoreductase [Arenicella xantha]|uniref:Sulfide:quinone oxidoreductase n=1 Tax=Arenicella xantha TaxID=644221 RepID=A0A395JIS1_9GAMM|nr:bifunctional protein tyrosine phosphatase family protein/NAD(P)/FAD-dependent oxidoreductase [Arenicella xantha]RBP50673.1 sulfide:quinone oxidoreductase [Arenicella xantha]
MKIEKINASMSVSDQILPDDITRLKADGVEILVCNRPDGESAEQPSYDEIKTAAEKLGIDAYAIPFEPGKLSDAQLEEFHQLLASCKKIHAYCRSGARSKVIFERANTLPKSAAPTGANNRAFDVVIVGAGSAGIATAASLRKRNKSVTIAVIDPSDDHYYQPGWTMVGGGVFDVKSTHRMTKDVIPSGVQWLQAAVTGFTPNDNNVSLDDGGTVSYQQLVIAPGLELNWAGIEGLEETLGKNGVTSNYRYDLAPYTWELVQNLKQGKAIFTQPPMPIKCAGAPQKALYLSASEWLSSNRLKDIDIEFYNAGGVLFGVQEYVPALMSYIEKYRAQLKLSHTLMKVDGNTKTAWFKQVDGDGQERIVETKFDFLHVCPPQRAPQFIRECELSDAAGWLDVDPATLQHKQYPNIWGAGDVMNTGNAKTMAAARKQAPVVAQNIANVFASNQSRVAYDGYGSCPLTVERGKIVLAEFTYGGKLAPSFPAWLNNGTKPTKFAWILKANILPAIYWHAMLKGREWMASPM